VIEAGKLHRFPGIGKRNGNGAAWCKLFADGLGGVFGDFASDFSGNWQAKRDKPFSPAEHEAFKRNVEKAKAETEAERKAKQAEAASKAAAIWQAAKPASEGHPYLTRKGIKASGARLHNDALVIPMRNGGELHSLQFIGPDGDKKFLTGGRVAGCYYSIGTTKDAKKLCIAEGFATGATIHEAIGYPVAVAFNAGNLDPVARALRAKFPDLALILCADDDAATEGNPGLMKATAAARSVGALVAIPDFGTDRPEGATDFNDLALHRGADAVKQAIASASAPAMAECQPDTGNAPAVEPAMPSTPEGATPATETNEQIIARLAALPMLEYDRVRKTWAKTMGIRPATLDQIINAKRGKTGTSGMVFDEVEPWPQEVDVSELLTEISATVRRFIVCERETSDTVALWAAMTWLMDVVQVAPLAIITSPEKRCGKSQLLFLLGKLAYRPMAASNISPAAMYRAIDAWNPTLLVDETDAFMRENEELRGIINAGHTRDSAYVVRTVGDDFTPKRFSVWGAKALAGIGHLADTLMDRAIMLELRRKLPHEAVERLRHVRAGLFQDQAAKLARFSDDFRETVKLARPVLPESLNDRQQDNWEPLLAIAGTAGREWIERAHNAALKLSNADEPEHGIGNELLTDIKTVFDTKKIDKIGTTDLIAALCADDEAPWNTYNRGKPVSPRQIARRLKGYGITSKNIRIGYDTPKGFEREQFDEAFSRYLSLPVLSINPPQMSTGTVFQRGGNENASATADKYPPHATKSGAGIDVETVARGGFIGSVADMKTPSATPKAAPVLDCGAVADKKGVAEGGNFVEVDV
jgi:putative DNA primase/helicase